MSPALDQSLKLGREGAERPGSHPTSGTWSGVNRPAPHALESSGESCLQESQTDVTAGREAVPGLTKSNRCPTQRASSEGIRKDGGGISTTVLLQ